MQDLIQAAYWVILLITAGCIILVNGQKPGEQQKTTQMIIGFIGITMVGYCFRIEADTLQELVLAQKLIYLGGCNLYYFMLMFYLQHCHIELDFRIKAPLLLINCILTAVTFTLDKHQLLYHSYWVETVDGFYILQKEYGFFHILYIGEVILYCLAMIIIALWYLSKSQGSRRAQSFQLLMVALCPSIPYVMEKVFDLPYDIVPFGMIAGLMLMLYLMYVKNYMICIISPRNMSLPL